MGGSQQRVWVLDDAQEAWLPGPDLPEPRAAWDGSRVVYVVLGGPNAGISVSGTVQVLDLE